MAEINARLRRALDGPAPQHKVDGKDSFEFTEGSDGAQHIKIVDVDGTPLSVIPTKNSAVESRLDSIENKLDSVIENGVINTQVSGSNVELDVSKESLEDLLFNQTEMINVLSDSDKVFGAYWDKSSDSTLTRTDAAKGMEANIGIDGELVTNDFDDAPIYRNIGDVTDEYGNVFVQIPKFYIRKKVGKDFKLWQISETKYPGFYLPNIFYDFENEKELPYALIGKHEASLSDDGSKLESKPGKHPLVEETIVNFRNLATANGQGYQLNDLHAIDALQTLFTVEFATLNSQDIMRGHVSTNYSNNHTAVVSESDTNRVIMSDSNASDYKVGQTLGIGTNNYRSQVTGTSRLITEVDKDHDDNNTAIYFDGDPVDVKEGDVVANRSVVTGFSKDILASSGSVNADDSKNPIVYRGIENPWGNIYEWIDGINVNDHQAWVAADARDYASNVFASPYEKLAYANHDGGNGYVKEMGYDPKFPYAEFPVEVGGSTSTYYADYYYQNAGQRVARFGGTWSYGSLAGLWLWRLTYAPSTVSAASGGRLLKKPL